VYDEEAANQNEKNKLSNRKHLSFEALNYKKSIGIA